MNFSFKEWLLLQEDAISEVPYLDGMDFEQAVGILANIGFKLVYFKGGYRHFRHPDGSEIKVRPDGRLKRIGPKMDSDDPRKPGRFQPKYIAAPGEDGRAVLTRHTFYPGGARSHGIMDLSHDSGERLINVPAETQAEWEGNRFLQEPDLVNGPNYPASKWKGPGEKDEEPEEMGREFERLTKDFGFKRGDEILRLQNRRMKKMKR